MKARRKSASDDGMRAEYSFDYNRAVRGKYAVQLR